MHILQKLYISADTIPQSVARTCYIHSR